MSGRVALAVELYFDAATEAAVRSLRRCIHEAGVPESPSLEGSRPHISLTVVETDDAPQMSRLVSRFARERPACPVSFEALSSFASSQGVLYLAPVPTAELLGLHAGFHALLSECGLQARDHYRPGEWIPHCTLEMDLGEQELATAFAAVWRDAGPLAGSLEQAAVVAFPPVEVLFVAEFAGRLAAD